MPLLYTRTQRCLFQFSVSRLLSEASYCILNIWGGKSRFLSHHSSFVTAGHQQGNGYLNLERQVGLVIEELSGSTCQSRLARCMSQGWNQLALRPFSPPRSDDKYEYRPSMSIQNSRQILKHAPKPFPVIWQRTGWYDTRLPVGHSSVRSVPALRPRSVHYCPS